MQPSVTGDSVAINATAVVVPMRGKDKGEKVKNSIFFT